MLKFHSCNICIYRCVFLPNKNGQNIENTEKQTSKIQARCPGSQGIDSLDERHLAAQNSTENGLDFFGSFKKEHDLWVNGSNGIQWDLMDHFFMDLMGFSGQK